MKEINGLRKLMTYFQVSLHVHSNSGYTCALPCKVYAFSYIVFMEDVLCPFSLGVWHTGENIPPFPFLLVALLNYSADWLVLLFIWFCFCIFFLSLDCCAFTKGLIWVRCHPWRLCSIFWSLLNTFKVLKVPTCPSLSKILWYRSSHSWISFGQMCCESSLLAKN